MAFLFYAKNFGYGEGNKQCKGSKKFITNVKKRSYNEPSRKQSSKRMVW